MLASWIYRPCMSLMRFVCLRLSTIPALKLLNLVDKKGLVALT